MDEQREGRTKGYAAHTCEQGCLELADACEDRSPEDADGCRARFRGCIVACQTLMTFIA